MKSIPLKKRKFLYLFFFSNSLKIELSNWSPRSIFDLNIFDISGKLLHNYNFLAGESEISTQDFKPGFYLVKVIIKGCVSTKKFIKS